MKIREIYNHIDKLAPFSLQEDWDNSGLQIGDLEEEVKGIVISLDTEEETINYAKEKAANLIINHHPLIFSKIKSLNFNNLIPGLIRKLIKEDISVLAAHTNMDLIYEGVNNALVKELKLDLTEILEVKEKNLGYGRCGNIRPTSTKDLVDYVKEKLDLDYLILYGQEEKQINRLAVIGGSGSFLIDKCIKEKVDLLISSDIKYHDYRYAVNQGLNIFDIGHFQSEKFVCQLFKDYIEEILPKEIPVYIYENRLLRKVY